jgi:hypothetical protein
MPALDFDTEITGDDGEPLFPPEDPLTITITDVEGERHVFTCKDRPNLPDDSSYGLDNRPRSYLLDSIMEQVVPEQQKRCREVFDQLMKEGVIGENHILDTIKWLGEQRDAARKQRAKRRLKRPTTAQSGSIS